MNTGLDTLFENLSDPVPTGEKKPVYAVARILPNTRYFVGKDVDGLACILIETDEPARRSYAPIRLESLDVRFQLKALLRAGDRVTEGAFTVIGCRSEEPQVVRYFL